MVWDMGSNNGIRSGINMINVVTTAVTSGIKFAEWYQKWDQICWLESEVESNLPNGVRSVIKLAEWCQKLDQSCSLVSAVGSNLLNYVSEIKFAEWCQNWDQICWMVSELGSNKLNGARSGIKLADRRQKWGHKLGMCLVCVHLPALWNFRWTSNQCI